LRHLLQLRCQPSRRSRRSETPALPAHWFHILLALADRDQHGLAITKEVFERTGGRLHLWPGMLYGALKKKADAGYVAEVQAPVDFTAAGGRPRFYRLTPLGRRVSATEAERMAGFVEAARAKRLIKRPRTT
jgi:DNA-binding PadR family transcriptional regulator